MARWRLSSSTDSRNRRWISLQLRRPRLRAYVISKARKCGAKQPLTRVFRAARRGSAISGALAQRSRRGPSRARQSTRARTRRGRAHADLRQKLTRATARVRAGAAIPLALSSYPIPSLTGYPDPRRDYWQRAVVPALKQIPLKAWERDTGKSQVVLIDARRGRRRPHATHRALLIAYARKRGVLR